MKVTGITAEYNPLHNGHVYNIRKARELTGCDAVAVAISGNYVQRGEPAILDKWKRTGLALQSGADLVVEIPALYCLGNAGQYARAGVRLLEALGCDSIAFGSECGDAELLQNISGFIRLYRDELSMAISSLVRKGYNYPVARARAYEALRRSADITNQQTSEGSGSSGCSEDADRQIRRELRILESSNDILAMEYIGAMKSARPAVIKREGAGYSDPYDIKFDYQSASALRTQLLSGRDISKYVPECTASALGLGSGHLNDGEDMQVHLTDTEMDMWLDLLRYAILTTPAEEIEDCPSGGEGLANLMKSEIMKADTWRHFVLRVKSKRYTYTRISRLCMQVLLGMTRSRYSADSPGYLRVLGFTGEGREVLSELKKSESAGLPVITNINKERGRLSEEAAGLLDLDIHASDIYNLATGRSLTEYSDHCVNPVIADL